MRVRNLLTSFIKLAKESIYIMLNTFITSKLLLKMSSYIVNAFSFCTGSH